MIDDDNKENKIFDLLKNCAPSLLPLCRIHSSNKWLTLHPPFVGYTLPPSDLRLLVFSNKAHSPLLVGFTPSIAPLNLFQQVAHSPPTPCRMLRQTDPTRSLSSSLSASSDTESLASPTPASIQSDEERDKLLGIWGRLENVSARLWEYMSTQRHYDPRNPCPDNLADMPFYVLVGIKQYAYVRSWFLKLFFALLLLYLLHGLAHRLFFSHTCYECQAARQRLPLTQCGIVFYGSDGTLWLVTKRLAYKNLQVLTSFAHTRSLRASFYNEADIFVKDGAVTPEDTQCLHEQLRVFFHFF